MRVEHSATGGLLRQSNRTSGRDNITTEVALWKAPTTRALRGLLLPLAQLALLTTARRGTNNQRLLLKVEIRAGMKLLSNRDRGPWGNARTNLRICLPGNPLALGPGILPLHHKADPRLPNTRRRRLRLRN